MKTTWSGFILLAALLFFPWQSLASGDLLTEVSLLASSLERRSQSRIPGRLEGVMTGNYSSHRSAFWPIMVKAGQLYGVDPYLVHAVVMVESDYNVSAISSMNACGLMQLMPETARELGVKKIFNPVENIHGGTLYLRKMLDRFDGHLRQALHAYNAGPGAVEQGRLGNKTRSYAEKVIKIYQEARLQG